MCDQSPNPDTRVYPVSLDSDFIISLTPGWGCRGQWGKPAAQRLRELLSASIRVSPRLEGRAREGWCAARCFKCAIYRSAATRLKPNGAPRVLLSLCTPPLSSSLSRASPPLTPLSPRVIGCGGDGQIRGGSGCRRKIGDIES